MKIQIIWFIITIIPLLWASWEDIKNRLIPDKIWLIQFFGGLIAYIWWMRNDATSSDKLFSAINIITSILFAFIFFYFGAFGGGDSKAVMVMAFSSPLVLDQFQVSNNQLRYPQVIYLMMNMLIIFIFYVLLIIIINLLEITKHGKLFSDIKGNYWQKLTTMMTARRISSGDLPNIKHYDPAEIYDLGRWKLYAPIFQEPLDDATYEKFELERMKKAIEDVEMTGREYIWMRWQPPGIVFLTISYLILTFIGVPLSFLLPTIQ